MLELREIFLKKGDLLEFFHMQDHVFHHSYPPVPEGGSIEGNDDVEPSGSSMFVAEAEADDATVDDGKKRRRAVIEDSEDSTDASPARDSKAPTPKGSAAAGPSSAPPSKKPKKRELLDEFS
jgi:hypothetical protein